MPDFASGGRYQNGVSLASIVRICRGRKRRGLPAGQTVVLRGLVPLSVKGWEGIPYSVLPGTAGMHALPETGRHAGRLRRSVFHGVVPVWDRTCGRFFRTVGISAVPCVVWGRDGFRNRFMPDTGHRLFEKCRFFHSGQPWRIHGGRLRGWPLFSPFRISFRQDGFIRFARGRTGGGFGGCLSVWFSPGGYMKRLRFFRCRLSVPAGRMFRIPFAFRRSRVGKALFSASACLS